MSYRGVWVAPWIGEKGETVLLVIDSFNRLLVDPVKIPLIADHDQLGHHLWAMLDSADPSTVTAVPPRFIKAPKEGERVKRLQVVR
jgi:hypothetical protein